MGTSGNILELFSISLCLYFFASFEMNEIGFTKATNYDPLM